MQTRKVYEDVSSAESLGEFFLGYYTALGVHRQTARQALERAGIREIKPEGWYPRSIILDVLRQVERKADSVTLFQVGKELANLVSLHDKSSFDDLLGMGIVNYPRYQRHIPDYERTQLVRDGSSWLYVYHTPWPSQGIRGYAWQLFRRFHPDRQLKMEIVAGAEDDFARTFRLSWDR